MAVATEEIQSSMIAFSMSLTKHQGSHCGGPGTLYMPWISQFPNTEFLSFFFFKYGLEMTIFQNFKYFQTSFRLKSRCFQIKIVYKAPLRDFPGGPVVKNLPANAEDTGLIPVLGGSHMPWGNQIRALQLLKPALYSPWATTREAAIVRSLGTATKSSPCLLQLEKACAQQWRPSTAKK